MISVQQLYLTVDIRSAVRVISIGVVVVDSKRSRIVGDSPESSDNVA